MLGMRWPAVKALTELERTKNIHLTILIPFGKKYIEFGRQLEYEKLTYLSTKKAEFEAIIRAGKPSIVLTRGWPFILTSSVLDAATSSIFINSHPSLLPKHRGSSPFWAAI